MFFLLVSLPTAGFVWSLPVNNSTLIVAVVFTAFSIGVAWAAEHMAASAERDLSHAKSETAKKSEELSSRDEKIRQLDRIIDTLSEQNHTLRGKLLSTQGELMKERPHETRSDDQSRASPEAFSSEEPKRVQDRDRR